MLSQTVTINSFCYIEEVVLSKFKHFPKDYNYLHRTDRYILLPLWISSLETELILAVHCGDRYPVRQNVSNMFQNYSTCTFRFN